MIKRLVFLGTATIGLAACGGDNTNPAPIDEPLVNTPVPTMVPVTPTMEPVTPTMEPVTPTMEPAEMAFVSPRADATGDFFRAVLFEDQDAADEVNAGDNIVISYDADLEALAVIPTYTDGIPAQANATGFLSFNPPLETVIGRTVSLDVAFPESYNLDGEGDVVSVGIYTFAQGGGECAFFESEIIETFDDWVTLTFEIPDADTGIGFGAGSESGTNCGIEFTGNDVDTLGFSVRLGGAPKDVEETIYIDNFVISDTTVDPAPEQEIVTTVLADFDDLTVGEFTSDNANSFTVISAEDNPLNDTVAVSFDFNQANFDAGNRFPLAVSFAASVLEPLIVPGRGDSIVYDYHFTTSAVDNEGQVQIAGVYTPNEVFTAYFAEVAVTAVDEVITGTFTYDLDAEASFANGTAPRTSYADAVQNEALAFGINGNYGGNGNDRGVLVIDNVRLVQGTNTVAQ